MQSWAPSSWLRRILVWRRSRRSFGYPRFVPEEVCVGQARRSGKLLIPGSAGLQLALLFSVGGLRRYYFGGRRNWLDLILALRVYFGAHRRTVLVRVVRKATHTPTGGTRNRGFPGGRRREGRTLPDWGSPLCHPSEVPQRSR